MSCRNKTKTYITNDCVGARVYQVLACKFDNPFTWSRLTYKDFKYVILHYDDNTINYNNIAVGNDKPNIIIIDGKIRPFYRHYIQDRKYDKPTQMNGNNSLDVHYYKITEYCVEKYKARLARFIENNSTPVFILNHKDTLKELGYAITTGDCMDFINLKTPYRKVLLTKDTKLLSMKSNGTLILKKNSENTYELAKQVVNAIKQKQ